MTVKAKFWCNSIVETEFSGGHEQRTVKFNAVYGNEGENADFAKATPSGEISMVIDPETKAYEAFVPGKSYYLTFEAAE